jgi:hypothetical protein
MNLKQTLIVALLGFSIGSGVAHADIRVKLSGPTLNGRSPCDEVTGNWKGQGTIETVCKYSGDAVVAPDGGPNHYVVNINLQHDPWYFWCPDPGNIRFSGTCAGDTITIKSSTGTDIVGSTDGHTAQMTGRIALPSGQKVDINSLTLTKV